MKKLLLIFLGLGFSIQSTFTQTANDNIGSGNCLDFDGNDGSFVQLTNALTVGSISSTTEMWVRVPQVGQGGLQAGERVGVLIGNYPGAPNFNYEIQSLGQIRVWWNNGEIDALATQDLRDNQWHHIAFVRDISQNRFFGYVDGQLELTVNNVGTNINLSSAATIGGDSRDAGGGPSFHGHIDEVRIWDHVLTQEEIKNNMCQSFEGNETGLIGYWNMNEGIGGVITDLTTTGNNGSF